MAMDDNGGVRTAATEWSATFASVIEPLLPLAYGIAYWLALGGVDAELAVGNAAQLAQRDFAATPEGDFDLRFLQLLLQCAHVPSRPGQIVGSTNATRRMLDALPRRLRIVNLLYFFTDFSYAEIAAIVGCSRATARQRLHHGRRLLRAALNRNQTIGPGGKAGPDAKSGTAEQAPPL